MQVQNSSSSISQLNALFAEIREAPSDEKLHRKCLRLFMELDAKRDPCLASHQSVVLSVLELLFQGDTVDHQHISHIAVDQLKLKYDIDAQTNPAKEQNLLLLLARDTLFLAALERTVNVDDEFESFLKKLRRFLLFEYQAKQDLPASHLRLAAALAQQGFNNEYILNEREDERGAVGEIEERLDRGFHSGAVRAQEVPLLVLGMFRHIALLPSVVQSAGIPLDSLSPVARPAIIRMIQEPLEERRLVDEIPSFGAITCDTSKAVRAQYEENPYPRWFNLGGPFLSLETRLTTMRPGFSWPPTFQDQRLEILVAGCGTGRHPLMIATGNPNAVVLAVDFSKPSLAYGKRMANRLKVDNLTFLHGDLLELPQIGKCFHHIECVGVLHHCLKDPAAAWCSLEQVLLPGGTLRIGVYSHVSRLAVEFIRSEIKRLGLNPTREEMKGFRHQLLTEERYKRHLKFLRGEDFYSLSSFRDLLFHTQESCYTLPEIKETIDHLGLEFLGFDLGSSSLEAKYRQRFPEDPHMNSFENWCQFESHYAGSRIMFEFWLQKKVG